jgi:phosphatidylglycerophosphatase A
LTDEPNAARTASSRLRWLVATAGGIGLAPIAPGTFGSLPGLAIAWALWMLGGWPALLAGTVVVSFVGLWAADGVAREQARSDPREVVVDEVAGQMLTLLFLPLTWQTLALGFLAFRITDIFKPFPARRLEALPGGLGIMVDDLVAGAWANLALQALAWWAPALLGAR